MTLEDSTTRLLDMVAPQRVSTWRFDVLNPDLELTAPGHLEVLRDTVPSMSHDSSAAIQRRLSGVSFASGAIDTFDRFSVRIRPMMILSNGDELPMGVFLFADANNRVLSPNLSEYDAMLVDQSLILDQPLLTNFYVAPRTSVRAAILQVLDKLPVSVREHAIIDGTSAVVPSGEPLVWAAGSSTYLTVLTDLAILGSYYRPHFDNNGSFRMRTVPVLSDSSPDVSYLDGTRIYSESIIEIDNLLDAPNVYLVVNNSLTTNPVVGTYYVPADLPYSVTNRGFAVPRVIQAQGITSPQQAQDMARALAQQDAQAQFIVSFTGPPDPRHDAFTIVNYRGTLYWEKSWTCQLREGSPMSHELRQVLE